MPGATGTTRPRVREAVLRLLPRRSDQTAVSGVLQAKDPRYGARVERRMWRLLQERGNETLYAMQTVHHPLDRPSLENDLPRLLQVQELEEDVRRMWQSTYQGRLTRLRDQMFIVLLNREKKDPRRVHAVCDRRPERTVEEDRIADVPQLYG